MKKSRDLSTHPYDEETAEYIYKAIRDNYFNAFKAPEKRLEPEKSGKQGELF